MKIHVQGIFKGVAPWGKSEGMGWEWEARQAGQRTQRSQAREPLQASPSLSLTLGGPQSVSYTSDLIPTLGRELSFHVGYQSVIDQRPPQRI